MFAPGARVEGEKTVEMVVNRSVQFASSVHLVRASQKRPGLYL